MCTGLNSEDVFRYGNRRILCSGNWCFIEWAEKIPNLIPTKLFSPLLLVKMAKEKLLLTNNS
jgi:tRNA threonylcarbamoyladenosine biosynthesis protein TsaE